MCRHQQLLSQFTNRVIPFQKNGNCHGSNNDRHFKQTTNYCKPLNHSRSSIFQLLFEPLFYRLTILFFFANPWNKRKFTIFLYKQIQLSNIVALKKKNKKINLQNFFSFIYQFSSSSTRTFFSLYQFLNLLRVSKFRYTSSFFTGSTIFHQKCPKYPSNSPL